MYSNLSYSKPAREHARPFWTMAMEPGLVFDGSGVCGYVKFMPFCFCDAAACREVFELSILGTSPRQQ